MRTIIDIIHATDRVSQRVTDTQNAYDDGPQLSPKQQAESIIAKNRVLDILSRSIKDVSSALKPVHVDSVSVDDEPGAVAMDVQADANQPPGDVLREGMSGKGSGLGKQVPSLQKMAEDTGPIIDTFKMVLDKPYLKNYNAMLNSVPVIGLKGDNVMYSEIKSGGVRGIETVWSVFSRIPDGVNINAAKAVHFFPYKGDFCMSVGTTVYRKKHRDDRDPEIKSAIDNWPRLYLDSWEKVGDNCLPTANALSVLPFARLTGKDIRFHLVVLADDGRLLELNGDLSGGNNTYTELKNATDEKKTAARNLKIKQAAFWNGNIVALDNSNNTWNLDVDFDAHTFTAADQMPVDPLLELTATDIGPVGVKSDGWIYRRRLETVNDPSDKPDKKIGWEKWIQQNGVTNLGVASPGVMLNLEALTRSLRDRYISTQTSIYPVVNKIQSFTINHELFLKKQLEAATEYQNNEDSATKQKIAIREAKKMVTQTKIWATIMRNQTGHGKTAVNLMGEELSSVRSQLDQQLVVLKDKLVSLEAQIKALKEAKSKMDAAFWGSIGVMLLGIGLAILGAATGVGVVALGIVGGALFVGGLVAACYFGTQSSKLAGQISDLESESRGVNEAISQVKEVAGKFGNLENMYGNLNGFWGRMFNAAQNLKDMNQVTALQIGEGILEDTTSIEASLDVVRKIKNGCATYLAILNRYGIRLAAEDSDDEDDETADIDIMSAADLTIDPTFKTVQIFNEQVERANQALENGKFDEHHKHLETASLIDICTVQMGVAPEAISQVLNTASGQENAEAADLFGDLANIARFTPLGMAVGFAEQAFSRDIDANIKDSEGPNEEAADLFGDLANLTRSNPIAGLVDNVFARDIDIGNGAPQNPEESAGFFRLISSFAKVNPIGRVVGTIGSAALGTVTRDMSSIEQAATDKANDTEAADLFGDLANFAHYTPFGITIGLAEQVFSRDVELESVAAQREQPEAADIFGLIADFARFTPLGAVANVAGILSQSSASPVWFAQQGLGASLALLATNAPFSSSHPSSGILNGILAGARGNIIQMLENTLGLTASSQKWLKLIPDVPTTDEDIRKCSEFQGQALLLCKQALEQSRLANNAFVDFNHRARDEQQRLNQEIAQLKDRIGSVHARGQDEIKRAQRPQVLDFITLGLGRVVAMSEARQIEARMRQEIGQLEEEIGFRVQELQSGGQFMGNSNTWVELCEQTSGNLGSIYNNLTAVKYGIKVDAQAYKELAETQWSQIRNQAEEVKALLQPRQGIMDMIAMDLDSVVADSAADIVSDVALVQIASPAGPLLSQLRVQVENSKIVWDNLGKLQRMTYTEDIVGYFDAVSQRKVTLKDVISSIQNAYIQTASLHYETIEHISSLALLQNTRADNFAKGKISPHVFIKGTLTSISMASKQAARVKSLMLGASPEIVAKLQLVKSSISDMEKAIADANLDLARRDKAYRDKVTGIIVEGCLTGFATGGLVAAAAFAAYSGVAIASIPALITAGHIVFGSGDAKEEDEKPSVEDKTKTKTNGANGHSKTQPEDTEDTSSEVDGEVAADKKEVGKDIPVQKRVEAAQDTWTALSGIMRSAKDAASATQLGKALFNKMSLADIGMLVQLVKTAIVVMERTAQAVERLSRPLEDLLTGVYGVADILADMDAQCRHYQIPAGGVPVNFGRREAEVIQAKWNEVSEACEVWLDVFNTQRISPITYSIF
ncbi:hypothetical protein Forpe1208_v001787 [Fusarium oxysporum f. sp. rapae]|uniref:Uncharacterized protein n=1 Tax=Fusarium oxysporum f. sp. rapae TaxID=485398 RepID=A0A8J5P4I6_FUSOX|nr:hypothetical protein Forpe1208_v001787 [Fusarium oxysporum f. sp. rapae]